MVIAGGLSVVVIGQPQVSSFVESGSALSNAQNDVPSCTVYDNQPFGFKLLLPCSWEVLENGEDVDTIDFCFRDRKYDGSFEWPGLCFSDRRPVSDSGLSTNFQNHFEMGDALENVSMAVFNKSGKLIYAYCALYIEQETLKICNQIMDSLVFY